MKAALHEVTGRNRYCGPTAVATILGVSTDHAAALMRAYSGSPAIRGAAVGWVCGALRAEGCRLSATGYQYASRKPAERPTLAAWLRDVPRDAGKHYIVVFRDHYGVVLGRQYLCSQTNRQRVRFADIPGRRGRVHGWIVVESLPAARPVEPTKPKAASAAPGVRKARDEAKRLAALHGIEIETLTGGGWNVWPPEWLPDDERDPFEGDHYANDWPGILEMVAAYSKLTEAREVTA